MGKSICLLPDSRATKQTSRRFAVWQTTTISLPRVTCDEEPFQCVNRQIAGALHFKLMHSTVPSVAPPPPRPSPRVTNVRGEQRPDIESPTPCSGLCNSRKKYRRQREASVWDDSIYRPRAPVGHVHIYDPMCARARVVCLRAMCEPARWTKHVVQ